MFWFKQRNKHFSQLIHNIKMKNRTGGPTNDYIYYISKHPEIKTYIHFGFCLVTTFFFVKGFIFGANNYCDTNSVIVKFNNITNWTSIFQLTFTCLALLFDVMEFIRYRNISRKKQVRFWRDVLFTSIVIPFTVASFLYFLLNIIIHQFMFTWYFFLSNLCIITITVLEVMVEGRRRPVDEKTQIVYCIAACGTYSFINFTVNLFTDTCPNTCHNNITFWKNLFLQIIILSTQWISYQYQFVINRHFHGVNEPDDKNDILKVLGKNKKNPLRGFQPDPLSQQWEKKFNKLKKQFEEIAEDDNDSLFPFENIHYD